MLVPSAFGPARPSRAEVHGVRDTWVYAVWGFLDTETLTSWPEPQALTGGWGLAATDHHR